MMHIILDLFKETKGKVVVPKIIERKALEYLTETHDILKWFYDNYERIDEYDYKEDEDQDVQTYISIKYILSRLRESTYYTALNVSMKRKISFQYIKDLFKTNELIKDDNIEAIDKTINKVRINRHNLLKNWELIVDNDSEIKEFNDTVDIISTDNPLSVTDTTSTTTTTTSNN